MKNKKQWVTEFQSIAPKYQLEIIEAIIKELKLNEDALDDSEYNNKKSQLLRSLFEEYIQKASSKAQLLQLQETFNRFNNLSDMDKQSFINQMSETLINYCNEIDKKTISERKKQEKQAKREFCKNNGHDFAEWKEKRWTTLEEVGDSGREALYTGVGTIEVEHVKWNRKCKYCGYVQTTSKKPDEIQADEIKTEIKKLQKSLDNLKK